MSAGLFEEPTEDEIKDMLRAGQREHDGGWGPLTARDIRRLIEESLEPHTREQPSITVALEQMGLVVPDETFERW